MAAHAGSSPVEARASPDEVLASVAGLIDVSVATLIGPSRASSVIAARAVAMHLLRTDAGLTYEQVSAIMGRTAGTVKSLTR